jgi:hypothetical protein
VPPQRLGRRPPAVDQIVILHLLSIGHSQRTVQPPIPKTWKCCFERRQIRWSHESGVSSVSALPHTWPT